MKYYIELGTMGGFKSKGKIDMLPIGIVIAPMWGDYNFDYPFEKNRYPCNPVCGRHRFTFLVGIFYWSIRIVFYSSDKSVDKS